jgi:hypothetical protein
MARCHAHRAIHFDRIVAATLHSHRVIASAAKQSGLQTELDCFAVFVPRNDGREWECELFL